MASEAEIEGDAHAIAVFFSHQLPTELDADGSLSTSLDTAPPETGRRVALLAQRARLATDALSSTAPPEQRESQLRAHLQLAAEIGQALVSRQDELERQLRLVRDARDVHSDKAEHLHVQKSGIEYSLSHVQATLDAAEDTNRALVTQLDTARQQLAHLKKDHSKCAHLAARVDTLTKQVDDARAETILAKRKEDQATALARRVGRRSETLADQLRSRGELVEALKNQCQESGDGQGVVHLVKENDSLREQNRWLQEKVEEQAEELHAHKQARWQSSLGKHQHRRSLSLATSYGLDSPKENSPLLSGLGTLPPGQVQVFSRDSSRSASPFSPLGPARPPSVATLSSASHSRSHSHSHSRPNSRTNSRSQSLHLRTHSVRSLRKASMPPPGLEPPSEEVAARDALPTSSSPLLSLAPLPQLRHAHSDSVATTISMSHSLSSEGQRDTSPLSDLHPVTSSYGAGATGKPSALGLSSSTGPGPGTSPEGLTAHPVSPCVPVVEVELAPPLPVRETRTAELPALLDTAERLSVRLSEADLVTLQHRLSKQNLPCTNDAIAHLSRTTLGAVRSESDGLKETFRALVESEARRANSNSKCSEGNVSLLTRRDFFALVKLIRTLVSHLVLLRAELNETQLKGSSSKLGAPTTTTTWLSKMFTREATPTPSPSASNTSDTPGPPSPHAGLGRPSPHAGAGRTQPMQPHLTTAVAFGSALGGAVDLPPDSTTSPSPAPAPAPATGAEAKTRPDAVGMLRRRGADRVLSRNLTGLFAGAIEAHAPAQGQSLSPSPLPSPLPLPSPAPHPQPQPQRNTNVTPWRRARANSESSLPPMQWRGPRPLLPPPRSVLPTVSTATAGATPHLTSTTSPLLAASGSGPSPGSSAVDAGTRLGAGRGAGPERVPPGPDSASGQLNGGLGSPLPLASASAITLRRATSIAARPRVSPRW